MSAPAPARAAYRALMRAVARRITAVSGNTLWRDTVRTQFRVGAAESDPAAAAAAVARAEDVAFMINSVNEHKARQRVHGRRKGLGCAFMRCAVRADALYTPTRPQDMLLSYGISLDKDAETKDRVKHTAARVGLSVAEYDEHGARKHNPDDSVRKRT
jgi:hypothetical protein